MAIDWPGWLRSLERKRRLLEKQEIARPRRPDWPFLAELTHISFRLEDLEVSEADVIAALGTHANRQALRPRQLQRLRNHVAILAWVETCLRAHQPLRGADVLRWYTSISCGLSTTGLDQATMDRLDQIVRRINSPKLRLPAAIQDAAALHLQLLADPLVPSFNGILARLLLRYHLGRCGLPAIRFDPENDPPRNVDPQRLLGRLISLIDAAYDARLGSGDGVRAIAPPVHAAPARDPHPTSP